MGNLKSKLKRSKSKPRKKVVDLPESSSSRKTVDPRLPYSNYRQIFNVRNGWKAVSRSLDDIAKDHLIRFFHAYPDYKESFPDIKDLESEEEMRDNMAFENHASEVLGFFDEIIANLENVDGALAEIHRVSQSGLIQLQMIKDMRSTFMETLKLTLEDRFTDTAEDNFRLLYDFIQEEMEK